MFDDKPVVPQGQAPQNLPLGEPEDLFAETEATAEASLPEDSVSMAGAPRDPNEMAPASALDAGILKPKPTIETTPSTLPPSAGMGLPATPPPVNPVSMPDQSLHTLKEPTMSRGIMTGIIIIVAVLLLSGAAWWVYRYINIPAAPVTETPTTDFVPDETKNTNSDQNPSDSDTETDNAVAPPDVTSSQPVDETILFGQIPDSDNDGLDDKREEALGTDPKKVDSDNDGFTDGDEVIVWGTDPLNPDTDGDGYLDGNEFKAGFNPKGPGKLFEAPTNSSATVSSTP